MGLNDIYVMLYYHLSHFHNFMDKKVQNLNNLKTISLRQEYFKLN